MFDELRNELVVDRVHHNKAFGCDARLARILIASPGSDLGGFIDVRVIQYNERIRTTEFEYAGLQLCTCNGRDGSSCWFRAGKRYSRDYGVTDNVGNLTSRDFQRPENILRQTRPVQNFLELNGASHDVRCMLQDHCITGHDDGTDAPKNLPERVVPWHHRENGTKRLILNSSLLEFQLFVRQESRCMLRVEIAVAGTLFDFSESLAKRLTHLQSDGFRDLIGFLSKLCRNGFEVLRSLGKRHSLPLLLGNADVVENRLDLAICVSLVCSDFFARCRVDTDERRRRFFLSDNHQY